ncbi:MAG: YhfC family intramembrane metalloprotease [Myxococcales bacterium]|nr:YhfC family intramembrane metalloprotease [Myxococcales bacterium]
MIVAAHAVQVLLLCLGPWLLARRLGRRWSRPAGLFGVGVMAFIFAEVARIAIARGLTTLFAEGAIPLPTSPDAQTWVSAAIAGVVAALTDEGLRVVALRRWIATSAPSTDAAARPEAGGTPSHTTHASHPDARTAALVGLGHGGGEALLAGLLTLGMAILALVGHGRSFEELEALGFEGRSAVRMGMKILAWWEASPVDALVSALQHVLLVGMHVGLTLVVARAVRTRRWRWLWLAGAAHAIAATLLSWIADKTPGMGVELAVHGGAAALALGLAWSAQRAR